MDRLFQVADSKSKYLSFLGKQTYTSKPSNEEGSSKSHSVVKPFTFNLTTGIRASKNTAMPPILTDSPQVRRVRQPEKPAQVLESTDTDSESDGSLPMLSCSENEPTAGPSTSVNQSGSVGKPVSKGSTKRQTKQAVEEASSKRARHDVTNDEFEDSEESFEEELHSFARRKSSTPQKALRSIVLGSSKKRKSAAHESFLPLIEEREREDEEILEELGVSRHKGNRRPPPCRILERSNSSVFISGQGDRQPPPKRLPVPPPSRSSRPTGLFQVDSAGFAIPEPPKPRSQPERQLANLRRLLSAKRLLRESCNEAQEDYAMELLDRDLSSLLTDLERSKNEARMRERTLNLSMMSTGYNGIRNNLRFPY